MRIPYLTKKSRVYWYSSSDQMSPYSTFSAIKAKILSFFLFLKINIHYVYLSLGTQGFLKNPFLIQSQLQ
jgi:hypothetical protein